MLLEEKLKQLSAFDAESIDVADRLMRAQGGNVYTVDLVVYAVLQRSFSLIDGFASLMRADNSRLAATFVRMQIDSAMRLNALRLVDDPNEVVSCLLNGQPLNKLTARDNTSLHDGYLHRVLSEEYPGASESYRMSSGFIHLSQPHLQSVCTPGDGREIEIAVGRSGRDDLAEAEKLLLVEAFKSATQCLLDLCKRIAEMKEDGRLMSPASETAIRHVVRRPRAHRR
jgi:hypothetical protein